MSVVVLKLDKGKMCAHAESIEEPPTFPEISDTMLEQALRQIPKEAKSNAAASSSRKKRGSVESESDFALLTGSGMFSERTGSAKRLKMLEADVLVPAKEKRSKTVTTGKAAS